MTKMLAVIKTVDKFILTHRFKVKVLEYGLVIFISLFLLNKSIDHLPQWAKDHIPFISRYQYHETLKQFESTIKEVAKRDTLIAQKDMVIDSLNHRKMTVNNIIVVNKKEIKAMGKNIPALDSILNQCKCL